MRWDDLKVEEQERRALPGYKDEAVVRTFDAPEALETRFHEVRAKSAINRVPERSRMPFRWTINPYRGCSHACTYCLQGSTPVLMGDGRTKPIADLRPGDRIYGTVRKGSYRRYVLTEVEDHWSTVKPAYRVTLEDGTELVASGDHRFLSDRGWKHVTGAESGPLQRAHLTTNNKLMGTGRVAIAPHDSGDYRRGYLCGLIRGDGHVGSYHYERAGRAHGDVHRFRLALTDFEALRRARIYLAEREIATDEFEFLAAAGNHRAMSAIRTQARAAVLDIQELIRWPHAPTDDWAKGFLAGIFDAEGSFGQCVRIANTDSEIIARTCESLARFAFAFVVEETTHSNGMRNVRIRGGLPEVMRFFHTTDPAISRKRSIEGMAIKSDARLRVTSIEPLGVELALYDITTSTGDFIANGVVSHNCFARPTHTYLGFNPGRDFEREIVVKVNAPELVRRELGRPSWKGEHVAMGTNTDPYQWVEGRYKLMPGIWEAMRDFANPCSILTKSPLLLRDKDLLVQINERAPVSASFSVPTLEEKAWRASEPRTPHPRARLEAVAELNRLGIPTGILIAPLMPGINDTPEQVEKIIEIASEAGAVSIGGIGLHLRGEVRDVFMDWLRSYRPDLIPRYEELYARGAYMSKDEQARIGRLVKSRSKFTRKNIERDERRASDWRAAAAQRAEA
ncbi:MAG: intein-containing Rv2578c family radical SAM protein, partial [Actinomycetota bacterium]|nr:intein-containing Rv2578c family radical SAM protein [Actinomycetota bacterium]